jgi:hypothetical protein
MSGLHCVLLNSNPNLTKILFLFVYCVVSLHAHITVQQDATKKYNKLTTEHSVIVLRYTAVTKVIFPINVKKYMATDEMQKGAAQRRKFEQKSSELILAHSPRFAEFVIGKKVIWPL